MKIIRAEGWNGFTKDAHNKLWKKLEAKKAVKGYGQLPLARLGAGMRLGSIVFGKNASATRIDIESPNCRHGRVRSLELDKAPKPEKIVPNVEPVRFAGSYRRRAERCGGLFASETNATEGGSGPAHLLCCEIGIAPSDQPAIAMRTSCRPARSPRSFGALSLMRSRSFSEKSCSVSPI
ncbi:hypothetical protein ACWTU8_12135 [Mesorhizobium sp. BHbdii]